MISTDNPYNTLSLHVTLKTNHVNMRDPRFLHITSCVLINRTQFVELPVSVFRTIQNEKTIWLPIFFEHPEDERSKHLRNAGTYTPIYTTSHKTGMFIQLTPWNRVLFDRLTGPPLLKKFPAFCGTLKFITAFTTVPACLCPEPDQYSPWPQHTSCRSF